jgi:hypothetical protein
MRGWPGRLIHFREIIVRFGVPVAVEIEIPDAFQSLPHWARKGKEDRHIVSLHVLNAVSNEREKPEEKRYTLLLFSALSNFLDASSEAMRLLASNSSVLLGSDLCLTARDGGASSSLESAFCKK